MSEIKERKFSNEGPECVEFQVNKSPDSSQYENSLENSPNNEFSASNNYISEIETINHDQENIDHKISQDLELEKIENFIKNPVDNQYTAPKNTTNLIKEKTPDLTQENFEKNCDSKIVESLQSNKFEFEYDYLQKNPKNDQFRPINICESPMEQIVSKQDNICIKECSTVSDDQSEYQFDNGKIQREDSVGAEILNQFYNDLE